MKKFFIIICGILVIGDAVASREPKKTSTDGTYWNVDGTYNTNVAGGEQDYSKFAPGYQFNSRAGTFGDKANGSIVAVVATRIYQNGGHFCTTQIQAGNSWYQLWMDYYRPENYTCETICKPGFYGNDCSSTEPTPCNTDLDYTKIFNQAQYDGRRRDSGLDYVFTTEMEVFDYDEPGSAKEKSNIVLGVIKRLAHGVVVAPVKVVGRRNGNITDVDTRIISANSNGTEVLLCASGFIYNTTKTDCVKGPKCADEILKEWCEGYYQADYKSDEHKIKIYGNCKKFECINSNYGFKSKNDKTCMECPGGALAYVNADGVCDKCLKGEYPNSNRNGCLTKDRMNTYSQMQMKSGPNSNRECWLETDGRKFSGCVYGCPRPNQTGECWNESRKQCNVCD